MKDKKLDTKRPLECDGLNAPQVALLPKLFATYLEIVLELDEDDRQLYEAVFLDWRTDFQVVDNLGMRPKDLPRAWANLLRKLHHRLSLVLRSDVELNENYRQFLENPRSFRLLMNLLRIYAIHGVDAVCETGKSRDVDDW